MTMHMMSESSRDVFSLLCGRSKGGTGEELHHCPYQRLMRDLQVIKWGSSSGVDLLRADNSVTASELL